MVSYIVTLEQEKDTAETAKACKKDGKTALTKRYGYTHTHTPTFTFTCKQIYTT